MNLTSLLVFLALVDPTTHLQTKPPTPPTTKVDVVSLRGRTRAELKSTFPAMKGTGDTVQVGEWRGWKEVWLTFNSKKVLISIMLAPKAPISLEEASAS